MNVERNPSGMYVYLASKGNKTFSQKYPPQLDLPKEDNQLGDSGVRSQTKMIQSSTGGVPNRQSPLRGGVTEHSRKFHLNTVVIVFSQEADTSCAIMKVCCALEGKKSRQHVYKKRAQNNREYLP